MSYVALVRHNTIRWYQCTGKTWRGWRDLNPRSPPWQGGALGRYATPAYLVPVKTWLYILTEPVAQWGASADRGTGILWATITHRPIPLSNPMDYMNKFTMFAAPDYSSFSSFAWHPQGSALFWCALSLTSLFEDDYTRRLCVCQVVWTENPKLSSFALPGIKITPRSLATTSPVAS